jgi:GT2 family glycosyltransferase
MISVIIPTFNRAAMLAKVLPSYLQSSLTSEIVIVDDGSPDETQAVLADFQNRDPRVIPLKHERNRGTTFARNTGVERAQGKYVLFSEDDLALGPQSLETLAAHMEETGADIIAGRRIWMRIGETEAQALERANSRRWPIVNTRLMEHYSHATAPADVPAVLVNATMLVRRDVLKKVRFADCYPGNAWREESDFQVTAQEEGYKVFFCPHALFYHYDRVKAGGQSRNRLVSDLNILSWIFRNNLTFLRRHRRYLATHVPEALWLNSPVITSLFYVVYRGILLAQTEARRAWRSRSVSRG